MLKCNTHQFVRQTIRSMIPQQTNSESLDLTAAITNLSFKLLVVDLLELAWLFRTLQFCGHNSSENLAIKLCQYFRARWAGVHLKHCIDKAHEARPQSVSLERKDSFAPKAERHNVCKSLFACLTLKIHFCYLPF